MNHQYTTPTQGEGSVDGHITFRLDPTTGRVRFMGEGPARAFQSMMLDRMPEPPQYQPLFEIPSVPREIAPAHDERLDRIEAMIAALAQQQQRRMVWEEPEADPVPPRRMPPASPGTDIVHYQSPGPERIGPPMREEEQQQQPPDAIGNMGMPLYDGIFTAFVRNVIGIRHETGTFTLAFCLFLLTLVVGVKVGIPMALNLISTSPEGQELLAENKAPPTMR